MDLHGCMVTLLNCRSDGDKAVDYDRSGECGVGRLWTDRQFVG